MKCKKNIIQDESGEKIYLDEVDNSYIVEYKDELHLAGKRIIKLKELGQKFSSINSFFFDYLNAYNIPTGYKKQVDNLVYFQKHSRYPFTINIYNVIDRRISRLFGKKEGENLSIPVFEFLYGTSKDNLITESHLISLDICPIDDLKTMKRICSKVNAVLKSYFERRNTFLAEIKCEFGKDEDKIFLVGSFTPKCLKVLPGASELKSINPFRFKSPAEFKNYTEFISGLTKN
ncbi:MAG: phosphoribosylaminoimidazolesuccinocarboxamide synthase [Bacillota bacterium]